MAAFTLKQSTFEQIHARIIRCVCGGKSVNDPEQRLLIWLIFCHTVTILHEGSNTKPLFLWEILQDISLN